MQETTPRQLNNLVAELLSLSEPVPQQYTDWMFTHPHDGWVFIQTKVKGKGRAWIGLDEGTKEQALITHSATSPNTHEAMRFLPAGKHRIRVWQEGQAVVEGLVVRAIPELLYCNFGYDPHIEPHGPYDWQFLQKHILPHVNVIVGNGEEGQGSFAAEAKKQGKRWLVETYAGPYFQRLSAEDSYRYWVNTPGVKEPVYDGIIVDEFFGKDEDVYAAIIESVRRLRLSKGLKHKLFYPYCNNMFGARRSEEFIRAVTKLGHRFAWERYLPEPATEQEANSLLMSRLTEDMHKWRRALPGCEKHMIVCFGFLEMITTESLNINPQVDFKVWLDMQFQHVATDPAFAGVYGLMGWTSGYADEETLRWAARLYRHYGIEGQKGLLSEQYGFRYRPDHIDNPDFEEGLKGWTVKTAEAGSVDVRRFDGYSWLQGRYPRTERGNTFLCFKRSDRSPNTISQSIRNLQQGKLYSLKMVTADYRNLVEGKSVEQKHTVSCLIEGAVFLPEKCFQVAVPNNYAHSLGPFNREHRFWTNYHYYVFRAKGRTAKLAISDWASENEPGAAIGQELMLNFIEVQPYLEET